MSELDDQSPKPHYRWPWFALAMVVLGILLAVLWMRYAVVREEQQRNVNAPLPGGPMR